MLRRSKSLKGYRLGAIDAELGHVKDFYFDDQSWKVRYLVTDTGHWLAHRKVLISPHAFGPIEDQDKILHVLLTREQVENSPSIDADKPVSRQFEEEYLRYFGWPFYWADSMMIPPIAPIPMTAEADESKPKGDPHLRSCEEVSGYHIQARDGDVGHVEDFLFDDSTWSIRDLVVKTKNWLPGKRVLVSPEWIKQVSWPEAKVLASLNRKSLQEFLEYKEEGAGLEGENDPLMAYRHGSLMPLP